MSQTWISIWVCQKHYEEVCELYGGKMPIMTIYNAFKSKCHYCPEIAKHFIDVHVVNIAKIEKISE